MKVSAGEVDGEQLVIRNSNLGLSLPMLWECGNKVRIEAIPADVLFVNSLRPLRGKASNQEPFAQINRIKSFRRKY